MPTPKLDITRAAQVLATAEQFGDVEAARVAGCSTKTVSRYRARMERDPELSRLVHEKREELLAKTKHWAEQADEFMSEALDTMRTKMKGADLRDVAGAYKIVGEMTITREALLGGEGDEPGSDPEGAETPEDSGGGSSAAEAS